MELRNVKRYESFIHISRGNSFLGFTFIMPLQPTRQQILRLYKHLIRYGNQLKFTDKKYFLNRIRTEFRDNSKLVSPEDIDFSFKKGETLLRKGRVL